MKTTNIPAVIMILALILFGFSVQRDNTNSTPLNTHNDCDCEELESRIYKLEEEVFGFNGNSSFQYQIDRINNQLSEINNQMSGFSNSNSIDNRLDDIHKQLDNMDDRIDALKD